MVKSQLDTHIYIPFSSKEIQYLLSKFKDDDELTNVVKTDSLIMKVVRALMFRKLMKNEAVNATKQRARTLARLLVQLRLVVKWSKSCLKKVCMGLKHLFLTFPACF